MNYLKERDGDLFSNADLKRLIVPLLIEQLLAIAVGMADSIMVSSVGEAAVSSVSLIDTIFILLINMFTAIATGGAVVCGQYIGKKRPPFRFWRFTTAVRPFSVRRVIRKRR